MVLLGSLSFLSLMSPNNSSEKNSMWNVNEGFAFSQKVILCFPTNDSMEDL